MKHVLRQIVSYFLRGLIFLVPTAATVYVFVQSFIYIDGIIHYEIPVLGVEFPGLGLLTLLGIITIVGMIGSTVLAQPFIYWGNQFLERAPLVKTVYTAVKDLISAFVGQEKRFDRPVLVKMYENAEVQKLGFLTREDLSDIGLGKEKVAVYLPHSYAFSGNLFVVPAANVTPIDAKPADVMKFIVSGGVTKLEDLH